MGTARLPAPGGRREAFPTTGPGADLAGRLRSLLPVRPGWRLESGVARLRWGRAALLAAGLVLLELLLAGQPAARLWIWSATLLAAGVGAVLCVVAGQRHDRSSLTWYASAGGCLSL